MTAFLWDAPVKSGWDQFLRYFFTSSIWLYPLYYAIALTLSMVALRKKKSFTAIVSPAVIPVAVPTIWILMGVIANGF